LHEAVKKKLNLSDEAWEDMLNQMTGRPNEEDVAKAKTFAREVLG
jgi:flavodoxin I